MAKSIRSKWKRKMRAVKRERYSKKELDRLKKTLGIDEKPGTSTMETQVSDVINFTTVDEIKEKSKEKEVDEEIMDQSALDDIKKFNSKTLRNENGAYPVWVHPRKIRKCKKIKEKRKKKEKGKVTKKSSK